MTQSEAAAFFDVDRTLVLGTTMERVFVRYLARRGLLGARDALRFAVGLAQGLGTQANKRHFTGKDAAEVERQAGQCFAEHIRPLLSAQGRAAVAGHQAQGHLVVLLTGSLAPLAEALRRELGADLALAARLERAGGRLTGRLANRRPYGPEKARLARDLAAERGLDLRQCHAYGDHHSDAAVLAAVGRPHAVNPDRGLRRTAARLGWPVERFR